MNKVPGLMQLTVAIWICVGSAIAVICFFLWALFDGVESTIWIIICLTIVCNCVATIFGLPRKLAWARVSGNVVIWVSVYLAFIAPYAPFLSEDDLGNPNKMNPVEIILGYTPSSLFFVVEVVFLCTVLLWCIYVFSNSKSHFKKRIW